MAGRATLDDVDMRARLRPLRHAGRPAAYVARSAPEPSRKLFQDVSLTQDFQFPAAFGSPAAVPLQLANQTNHRPARQAVPVAVHKPEPSRVLMRQTFAKPKPDRQPERIHAVAPLFEAAVAPVHRDFTPPPTSREIMMRRLRGKPVAVVTRLHRIVRTMPAQQRILVGLAALVLVVGTGISFSGLLVNKKSQIQAAGASIAGATAATTTGSDSSAPSTAAITEDTIRSYQVAPDLARYISIPKLGVYARVLQVGVTKDGALATPGNVFDAAWYKSSAKPGQPGATLIDGHVSSWTTNGVFYGIKKLVAGDTIAIQRGDGKQLSYSVVKTVAYPVDSVDMNSLIQPVTAGKSGLNLITCGGKYDSKSGEFTQRIAVYATLND